MEPQPQMEDCDYLRLLAPDICGQVRSKIITPASFESFAKNGLASFHGMIGLGCDGTPSLRHITDRNFGNGALKADWSTLYRSKSAGTSEARYKDVICQMYMKDGQPLPADTRHVLRQLVQQFKDLGLSVYSTYEIEFRLFKSNGEPAWPEVECFRAATFSKVEPFLHELRTCCSAAGIQIEVMHAECGSGQIEINMQPQFGVTAADHGLLFKLIAKEVAFRNNYEAVFVTKPLPAQTGNGWHLNLSLWTAEGRNAFYNGGSDTLSPIARQFMAGLVHHAPGMTALCSPTVNCYRRLHTPWAPHVSDMCVDGRNSSFRLHNYAEARSRVENRIISSAANPYLALAATLAAGIDGIRRDLQLDEQMQQRELPRSLAEAIKVMEDDDCLTDMLGADVMRWFTMCKADVEVLPLKDVDISEDSSKALVKERALYWNL